MNIQIEQTSTALTDFVFRAADRMRIDGCANAIAREGLSLALHCEHEALLDHYVNLLLARLRQQVPEPSIEVYFPANTDSLLDRFNEVLAQQSVKQAVKGPTTASQAQIWLVHDAQSLPDSEVQLLARLIQNFPGANIRAILMMTGKPGKTPLSAFGRKILRWDIEAPNEEQTQAALELARTDGRLQAVSQLIRQIQRRSWASAEAEPIHDPAPPVNTEAAQAPLPGLKNRLTQFQEQGQNTTRELLGGLKQLRTTAQKNMRLTVSVILALLASTVLMMWLQPEAFGIGTQIRPLPKPPAASAPLSPTAPTAKEVPQPPQPATPSPVTEAPDPAVAAQDWVRSLDPQGFLVQHGTNSTYASALTFKNKFAGLKQAEIVAAYRPGETLAHFVIVSGPYSEVTQGYDAAKRRDIPGNSWVRATRTLQAQLKAP
jgi:hypothetical protein